VQCVIVIGAGILGASIAYHLARGGAQVTVLAATIGGTATPNSFAWINASWGNDPIYFRLRFDSLNRWRKLEQEIPDLGVSWGGSLTYDMSEEDLRTFAVEFGSRGYPLRLVDAGEALKLEPHLLTPPRLAVHAAAEGSVEPNLATAALLKASAARIVQTTVHGLDLIGHRVNSAMTADGPIEADHFIIAAGTGTAALLATIGVSLEIDAPPGLLLHTLPIRRLLRGLIIAPDIHMRQAPTGEIVAGSDFGGSAPDLGPVAVAVELMDILRKTVRGTENLGLARYSIGYRPTPKDTLPIVGRIPGVVGAYVAVMHSGVTNAPAIGAYVAEDVLGDRQNALIAPYGTERFL
jgi:glycine/D-amino acid oxidase-like deaminating enzyme